MSLPPLKRRVHLGLRLGPPSQRGAGPIVRAVAPQSCAEMAGVRPLDQLVRIGDQAIESVEDARVAQRPLSAGELVHLEVERDGERLALCAPASAFPLEQHPGATVSLDHVEVGGLRLRTIELSPERPGPHPIVYYLPGAHWASEEYSLRPHEPVPTLLRGLADAGFASLRVERSGVGDSEGAPCSRVGFERELSGYRRGLTWLRERSAAERPIFLLGHSVGAMVAPLLAQSHEVAGIITFGASALSIADALLGAARRFLTVSEADATVRRTREAALSEMVLGMIRGCETPEQIFEQNPALRSQLPEHFRGDSAYGRCVAFFQELERQDLAAAWGHVTARTLLLHGSRDAISSLEDSQAIARLVAARAEVCELDGVDHQMSDRDANEEPRLAASVLSHVTSFLARA